MARCKVCKLLSPLHACLSILLLYSLFSQRLSKDTNKHAQFCTEHASAPGCASALELGGFKKCTPEGSYIHFLPHTEGQEGKSSRSQRGSKGQSPLSACVSQKRRVTCTLRYAHAPQVSQAAKHWCIWECRVYNTAVEDIDQHFLRCMTLRAVGAAGCKTSRSVCIKEWPAV